MDRPVRVKWGKKGDRPVTVKREKSDLPLRVKWDFFLKVRVKSDEKSSTGKC